MPTTPRRQPVPLSTDASTSRMSTPLRKKPHCSSCGSPMLGHKRGQCTPVRLPSVAIKIEHKDADGGQIADDVTLALKSLNIQAHVSEDPDATIGRRTPKKRQSNRFQVPKAETLLSLDTDEQAGLDGLVRPGIMDDTITEDDKNTAAVNLNRWFDSQKDFLNTPTRPAKRTPRSSGAHEVKELQDFDHMLDLSFSETDSKTLRPAKATPPKVKEEEASGKDQDDELLRFVQERSKKPAANVYTIPAKDVEELEARAKKLNIPIQIIEAKHSSKGKAPVVDGSDVCVLVGKKGESVDDALKKLEVEDTAAGRSILGTALKSGAVGVVATWMYLAFS